MFDIYSEKYNSLASCVDTAWAWERVRKDWPRIAANEACGVSLPRAVENVGGRSYEPNNFFFIGLYGFTV